MDKDTFSKLKVADIKALFETEQALEILSFAQEDTRSSVQKLAASYIKRQEKELKEQQRLMGMYDYEGMFYDIIKDEAVAVSCISYGPEKIDELNIYEATRQAMYEAIRTLSVPAEAVVADAMKLPDLRIPVESIIKGDSKSANIAAASIIAKVTRDRYMKSLDDEFPGYGFGIHKGYYTELHKEAIEQQGVTPLHRKSFEPIKSIVRWVKPE